MKRAARNWPLAIALAAMPGCDPGNGGSADGSVVVETDAAAPDGSNPGGPCQLPGLDLEPNDTRDRALALTWESPLVGCIGAAGDRDFFSLQSPDDATGGYGTLELIDVGEGLVEALVYGSDNSELADAYALTRGQSVWLTFATAPGQSLRIQIRNFSSFAGPFRYRLKVTYNAVADAFEPNDTRETAKPLVVGATTTAALFAGAMIGGAPAAEAYDDWYTVDLAAGLVTIKVEDVPGDLYAHVFLKSPAGADLSDAYASTKGQSVTTSKIVTAGRHAILVRPFGLLPDAAGKGPTPPDHFTHPYKLRVTQP